MKVYHYGTNIINIGGCNFQQLTEEFKRTKDFIDEEYSGNLSEKTKYYEQPYYEWEASLRLYGNESPLEGTQSFHRLGWRGVPTIANVIPGEEDLAHWPIRK